MLRYMLLVQLYHWTTFLKQNPLQFTVGVLLFPYFFLTRMLYPSEVRTQAAIGGIEAFKAYWQLPGAIAPPACVKKRMLALESELRADV